MIPDTLDIDVTAEPAMMPSYTYYVDPVTKRINRKADGAEAIQQAAEKAIQTERFAFPIYSDDYGAELERLIGQDMPYIVATLKDTVTETLLADDRFISVENFEITSVGKNELAFNCTAVSVQGVFEINYNG